MQRKAAVVACLAASGLSGATVVSPPPHLEGLSSVFATSILRDDAYEPHMCAPLLQSRATSAAPTVRQPKRHGRQLFLRVHTLSQRFPTCAGCTQTCVSRRQASLDCAHLVLLCAAHPSVQGHAHPAAPGSTAQLNVHCLYL